MARFVFAMLSMFLLPAALYAQDGPSAAIAIVEDFSREANTLMKEADFGPLPEATRDKAAADLRNIRVSEQPGAKRAGRIYATADSYMGEVLKQVEGLKPDASVKGRKNIDGIIIVLKDLRQRMLGSLKKTLSVETAGSKKPKEVPSFDSSPFDEPPAQPDGPPGILYR